MFEIDKYKTDNGKCPFDEYRQELINSGQKLEVAK